MPSRTRLPEAFRPPACSSGTSSVSRSGPVQIPGWFDGRDKLFFMGNYEGFRLRNQRQTVYSVPSAAMRNGDFSQVSTIIRDPRTSAPFPGNVIPGDRISPISRALLDYYPAPNQPTSGLVNNYLAVNQDSTDKNQFTTRIDFVEGGRSTWYGRYSWTRESIRVGGLRLNGAIVSTKAQQAVVDNARVLTQTLVNEMRFGYNKFFNHSGGELNNVRNPIAEIGLALPSDIPADAWGLPQIAIAGFSGFGDNSESPFINSNKTFQFIDNMSWTRGSHFLKFGGEVRLDHYNQDGNQFARGSAGFNNNIATGYGFADYLLGYIGDVVVRVRSGRCQAQRRQPVVLRQRHVENQTVGHAQRRLALRVHSAMDRLDAEADCRGYSVEYAAAAGRRSRSFTRCWCARAPAIFMKTRTSGFRRTFR